MCLQTHLPGYVEKADELKKKGVEVIACISVNDPFVMEAWGKSHNATGKVRLLLFELHNLYLKFSFENEIIIL